MNKYLTEIRKRFETFPPYKQTGKFNLQDYIGTQIPVIGLKTNVLRELFTQGYSFNSLPINEQLKIWEENWFTAETFEQMSHSLLFIGKHMKKIEPNLLWEHLVKWQERNDNWAHSDELSKYYSFLLECLTEKVYEQLKIWNTSNHLWDRRQSLVSLLYYYRFRKKYLPFESIISMIHPLLDDEAYMVQKGIGWSLRELSQLYPKETLEYLYQYYYQITSIAFAAAGEKLLEKDKKQLIELRKMYRLKK